MRYIKLFLISVVVFGVMLFCLSLLFPSITYVSRAMNVNAPKSNLMIRLPLLYGLSFEYDNKANQDIELVQTLKSIPKGKLQYYNDSFERNYTNYTSDTFSTVTSRDIDFESGVAVYELGKDSTAVQVFYKIYVPWYKPWKKFGLMLNETKYGPSLDSAISRISQKF